jgi:hypothetical protein
MLCAVMDRGRPELKRFVAEVEPRLRRALVAGFGSMVGRQAAAEALARAWQNWVVAPERRFEEFVAESAPIIESIEFHPGSP